MALQCERQRARRDLRALTSAALRLQKLFYNLTAREESCPFVDEFAFHKLMRHVSEVRSNSTGVHARRNAQAHLR